MAQDMLPEADIADPLPHNTDGIHIAPRIPHLSVKLQNAFVNYTWQDWLQVEAGYLIVPTYWRTHRYRSTNLTVDEPIVDQNVFPAVFEGVMLHGNKYFEDGGISYVIYGGVSQELEVFDPESTSRYVDYSRAIGGKLVAHAPSRHFVDAFDIGYQRLEQRFSDRDERLDGAEMGLEKGGFDWLNRDSRYDAESGLARQSVGLTYRQVTPLSRKIEANRYQPRRGRLPAYYGASVGAIYFFHLP